ncbi:MULTISPECIES: nucleotide exchange factor GrpE [Clostridium]|uniref:Protein GrpE n=2 Tax=Clostridium TaxID=1485 RepID=A0A151AM13_9CLOT|nr:MULTISPECIES: nucleotide exchange factor GrpE [Clostridium]KYH28570.1 protein GrpE [Clostridium colicanis DSM 13634]MBE6042862.1 nucleotide exchange factor GrpE [Clostridium thermopalmarium]PRR74142.1 heat shock protein GrpE [Clostridium thermopalmarium DSM 5974]PVZ25470.1 molecular chaperone GrpE [Clostridium thermopalmarium DSM 5974]
MINDENLKQVEENKEELEEAKEENLKEEEAKEETLKESEVNEDMEFEELKEDDDIIEENIVDDLNKENTKLKDENLKLKDENTKLKNELEALKDRLLRISAEYDNFRKRTDKEKKLIYTDACADILKHMLPVFDNLERAIVAEGNAEDLKKGIEITIKQFNDAFEKLGVEEIPTDGEFDPNYHNAIMHIEDDSFGKNQIVEVFQKGFKREDKVLRFSLVKVAN